jgi:hypothetical protein
MNTQPDWSRDGNSELLARAIETNNWLRTDSIFIENEQIEVLSNRPPWIAAVCEAGLMDFDNTEKIIQHVMDVGANYWSIWNFHNISARNVMSHYEKFRDSFDLIARSVGYRVRPSWIWSFKKGGLPGLIFGFVNDGIADVPGILRITVFSEDGKLNVSGSLDAGYPKTRGVRQAMAMLPSGTDWRGLRLKAELQVKGVVYPVRWACRENLNDDGSLTLRRSPSTD